MASRAEIVGRVVTAGALTIGIFAVSGCSNPVARPVKATKTCEIFGKEGKHASPARYPDVGQMTAVQFTYKAGSLAHDKRRRNVTGTFIEFNHQLVLNVPQMALPGHIAPDAAFSNDPRIAASINTPETDSIGFTAACLEVVQYPPGVQTTIVHLPGA